MKNIFCLLSSLIAFSLMVNAQTVKVIAGDGGTGAYNGNNLATLATELNNPTGIAFDKKGNLYYADGGNNLVREIDTSGNIITIAGNDTTGGLNPGYNGDNIPATSAQLSVPVGLAFDTAGNLYIADGANNRIRKVNTSGIITTVAGTHLPGYNGDRILADTAELFGPSGIAFDSVGNMYITEENGSRVRKIDTKGYITTVVGNGTSGNTGDNGIDTNAEMEEPYGICFDKAWNMYITDIDYDVVRKVNTAGIITTLAGTGTGGYNGDGIAATSAELNQPEGIVADGNDNIYITDGNNGRIRVVNPQGIISTYISDTGEIISPISFITAINLDTKGNMYFSDGVENIIYELTNTTGINTVLNTTSPIMVFPNPASDYTIVSNIRKSNNNILRIYNLVGQTIFETPVENSTVKLDVTNLPSGVYFISVNNAVEKLVKE